MTPSVKYAGLQQTIYAHGWKDAEREYAPVVDALERLVSVCSDHDLGDEAIFVQPRLDRARDALRRLRDEVPA